MPICMFCFSNYTVQAQQLVNALIVDAREATLTDGEIEELAQKVQRTKLKIYLQLDERVNQARRKVARCPLVAAEKKSCCRLIVRP